MKRKFKKLIWFADKSIGNGEKQHGALGKDAKKTLCGVKRNDKSISYFEMDLKGKRLRRCKKCISVAVENWGSADIKLVKITEGEL